MTFFSSTTYSRSTGRPPPHQRLGIDVLEIGSAEAWASAGYVHRLYGRMALGRMANYIHVSAHCIRGIARLMEMWKGSAPRERWAAGCFIEPSVEPSDVAEWFCEPLDWAEQVYSRRRRLFARWQHTESLARAAVGMFLDDPAPEQIRERCLEVLKVSDIPLCRRVLTSEQVQRMWQSQLSRLAG